MGKIENLLGTEGGSFQVANHSTIKTMHTTVQTTVLTCFDCTFIVIKVGVMQAWERPCWEQGKHKSRRPGHDNQSVESGPESEGRK